MSTSNTVPVYDRFELSLTGPDKGNPHVSIELSAIFRQGNREIFVPGFYDGNSTYRIRFMPPSEGVWSYCTTANSDQLDGITGSLKAIPAREGVHGPVRVRNRFHFAYDDGTPYAPFGTTCYVWQHQPLSMQEETLQTLAKTGFNKLRMAVFPKEYPYNQNEPIMPVFEPDGDGGFRFEHPNFKAFQHLERQIERLGDMGIEADLILFHPYDRWGYCQMGAEADRRYVAYLAARLGAYRNVWWSLANEYDFLLDVKPVSLWDEFFHILEEQDQAGHLRSIHNGDAAMNFDHRKPWVTHVCIQHPDVKKTQEWREAYGKPVVNDELEYEGNIFLCWGNISARELVHRFWITALRGGYAGHGETYEDPQELLWWAKGGELRGESWKRIKFMREILARDVKGGLEPLGPEAQWPWHRVSGARDIESGTIFIYLGEHQPNQWTTGLPKDDGDYDVSIIDPWEMTETPAEIIAPVIMRPVRHANVTHGGKPDAAFGVKLPSREGLVIRVRRKG
ncbi:DUF5060 domain-containing protein [uncultured Cohaesibacter sp.]|uniref:DUF5060 domain-containing protein n=1 Tax=uncultured Cohaesibacter sp. TaxID=1002546 RepID=UPI00292E1D6B|nr:DUF5060 domain-containing protein [uncultured Cohaesibacter sp.]